MRYDTAMVAQNISNIIRDHERILKALANRRRLAIILMLRRQKEAAVGEIADGIRLSLTSTSKHLGILSSVDILEKDQRSSLVYYRISGSVPVFAKNIIDMTLSHSRE